MSFAMRPNYKAGGINDQVHVEATSASDFELSPTSATATVSVQSDGTVTETGEAGYTWLLEGAAGDYEVFVATGTGDAPAGSAVNTWLALSSTRSWTLTTGPAVSFKTWNSSIKFRNASTLEETASYGLSINVNVDA